VVETNVLVVDDSLFFRDLIRTDLESNGYRVLLAEDGAQALSLYRSHDIHILITDLEMPVMTGLELCWHVRAEDDQHRTFTILMTGDTETARRIEAFDSGADEFLAKPIDLSMLRARVRAGERITRMHRVMVEMLHTDYLTGVLNRRYFMERLEQAYRAAKETGSPLAVAMFDIDHFKAFNDTHGHLVGDHVLKLVARMLTECIKGRDTATRYGGEEFAIILPRTSLENAIKLAEQVRTFVGGRQIVNKARNANYGTVALSVGVAQFRPGEPAMTLVRRADQALYAAKRSGRNRVSVEAG